MTDTLIRNPSSDLIPSTAIYELDDVPFTPVPDPVETASAEPVAVEAQPTVTSELDGDRSGSEGVPAPLEVPDTLDGTTAEEITETPDGIEQPSTPEAEAVVIPAAAAVAYEPQAANAASAAAPVLPTPQVTSPEPEQTTAENPAVKTAPGSPVRRFSLIDPNQHWFIVFCLVLFSAILLASIIWSFNAIVEMSEWMAPNEDLRWLPAVFLDLAIIGYSFTLAVFKSRGALGMKKIWQTRMGLAISTGFSVIANATHTLDFWDGNLSTYQAQIGLVFSAAIPLLALMATEEIVRLAFVDPNEADAHAEGKK